MSLSREEKAFIIDEVKALANESHSVVLAEYTGLTVAELTNLRKKAHGANVKVKVVKNTLAKKAFAKSKYDDVQEALKGPLVLLFSNENLCSAAKVVHDFSKENELLVPKALSIGSGLLGADQLKAVAQLPTFDEAIGKLMFVMLAPVEKLARTVKEIPSKLVRTVSAIKDAKAT